MTFLRPLTAVVFAIVFALNGAAEGQPAPPPVDQAGGLRGLPPEALQNIVASAQPDTPAILTLLNRPIVTFRASLLNRSAADRAAAAKQLLTAFASEGRPLAVSSRELAGAVLVAVDGRLEEDGLESRRGQLSRQEGTA